MVLTVKEIIESVEQVNRTSMQDPICGEKRKGDPDTDSLI
jgi:hypothetical protein